MVDHQAIELEVLGQIEQVHTEERILGTQVIHSQEDLFRVICVQQVVQEIRKLDQVKDLEATREELHLLVQVHTPRSQNFHQITNHHICETIMLVAQTE